jgi:hypothetical protein
MIRSVFFLQGESECVQELQVKLRGRRNHVLEIIEDPGWF